MSKKRTLSDIESDVYALRLELVQMLKDIFTQSGRTEISIPYDTDDPVDVYFSDNDTDTHEGRVTAVGVDGEGLYVDVGYSCPDMTLYENEHHHLFNSPVWLIGICRNLGEILAKESTKTLEMLS